MKLADLQRAFSRRVLAGDDAILAEINDSPREGRASLFHVYEHAYGARLAEVLEADYEKLLTALGRDEFLEMAAAYVAAEPSRHPNARFFGRKLAAFLASTAPWSETPWLAELAALEWAMGEAFAAPDEAVMGLEAMAAVHPQDWPWLRFAFVENRRMLDARHGGPEAWLALDAGEAPVAAAAGAEPGRWIVWREDGRASFRLTPPAESAALEAAAAGARFAEICDGLIETAGDEAAAMAAGFLKTWIESGLVTSMEIAGPDEA